MIPIIGFELSDFKKHLHDLTETFKNVDNNAAMPVRIAKAAAAVKAMISKATDPSEEQSEEMAIIGILAFEGLPMPSEKTLESLYAAQWASREMGRLDGETQFKSFVATVLPSLLKHDEACHPSESYHTDECNERRRVLATLRHQFKIDHPTSTCIICAS